MPLRAGGEKGRQFDRSRAPNRSVETAAIYSRRTAPLHFAVVAVDLNN
jgi:hypothetical protein